MKKYFTVSEAAKICSVDRSTMHRWVAAKKLKAYSTPGGHKRILIEDLKKWLEENDLPFDLDVFGSRKTRILIVDDDRSVRKYLKTMLKGLFIDLETAVDGFEAGKKVVKFQPDLMILDLFMPNMNGFEVCKNIKSDTETRHIKVLVLSGYWTEENEQRAFSSGADAFLKKPSSKGDILRCIENLLGQ